MLPLSHLNCLKFQRRQAPNMEARRYKRAGVSGFEPELPVLETGVLTVDTIPLYSRIEDRGSKIAFHHPRSSILDPQSSILDSFCLLMGSVLTAKTTELFELQTLCRFLLVFGGDVIAIFAIATLQNDIVSHNFFGGW